LPLRRSPGTSSPLRRSRLRSATGCAPMATTPGSSKRWAAAGGSTMPTNSI
jgi:hypothetical protein